MSGYTEGRRNPQTIEVLSKHQGTTESTHSDCDKFTDLYHQEDEWARKRDEMNSQE